jgi:hypothetical protein
MLHQMRYDQRAKSRVINSLAIEIQYALLKKFEIAFTKTPYTSAFWLLVIQHTFPPSSHTPKILFQKRISANKKPLLLQRFLSKRLKQIT